MHGDSDNGGGVKPNRRCDFQLEQVTVLPPELNNLRKNYVSI